MTTKQQDIESAALALLNDIESMRSSHFAVDSYGPFLEWEASPTDGGIKIVWPNLSISASALAKALAASAPED